MSSFSGEENCHGLGGLRSVGIYNFVVWACLQIFKALNAGGWHSIISCFSLWDSLYASAELFNFFCYFSGRDFRLLTSYLQTGRVLGLFVCFFKQKPGTGSKFGFSAVKSGFLRGSLNLWRFVFFKQKCTILISFHIFVFIIQHQQKGE